MDRSDIVYLISESFSTDDYGVKTKTETKRKVYAAVVSVNLQEWTEGGRVGLNPEFRMTVFAPDYNGEQILEYRGRRYTIYRTYYSRTDTMDLYVERRQGNAGESQA